MPFNLFDHPVYLLEPQRLSNSAWAQHTPFGMLLIDLTRPRLLVELGTHTGLSYCAFCQAVTALHLDTRCVAVDSWEGDPQAGEYGPEILADLRAHHDPRYAAFSTLMQSRFDDALGAFDDGAIDLLHIDGFHTYEAVKHDLDSWLPKMSARGVIVLHDVAERKPTFGVWRLWDELKQRYPRHLEFEYGHGLGVVAVGAETPAGLQSLLDLPSAHWETFCALMQALGVAVDERITSEAREQKLHLIERRAELTATHASNLEAIIQQQQQAAQQQQQAAQRQATVIEAQEQHLSDTQRQLDNALWQLDWLNRSRTVRIIKLARASRALARQHGPLWLARRVALWTMGQRGYYRLDSSAALPAPKSSRPTEREDKQVMFLSGCPGGAMRYRCDHQAEQLNLLGCSAESAAIGTVDLRDLLDRFQCFVLHRVPMDNEVQAFVAETRKRGKALFFETDDLVFAPDSAENTRYQAELERFSPQERALYLDEMARIRQTARLCDAATVSTEPLVEWVAPMCAHVAVTPNVVSQEMIARSQMALAARAPRPSGQDASVTIAYLSGSPSHDRDFLEAQDAVLWALETYPRVNFMVVGPLTLSDRFERFGARVRREPLRPWQALPALYADVAINLAPLERENPFTEAKSCIKFLEAALLKIPTVASARTDFRRVMRDGENGLLADTPDAWRAALRRLIESAEERRVMGERAYEEALRLHTTRAQAPLVFDVMRDAYRVTTPSDPSRRLRVNWVMDATDAERPEQMASLRVARALAERGHTVRICLAASAEDEQAAWQAEAAPAEVVVGCDALPPADASIATSDATERVVARQHETRFRFSLAEAAADECEALPLRHISLEGQRASQGQPTDAAVAAQQAEQLAQTLLDSCW